MDVAVICFRAGLIVHPHKPKAWAMIVTGFSNFVTTGTSALQAIAVIAICILGLRANINPIWTYGGDRIAQIVAGTTVKNYLMRTLAALTVASVPFVLFAGGSA